MTDPISVTHHRPNDIDELRSMVVALRGAHSESARRILERAFRTPDLIAFGNATSAANACDVSPSTMLRLSRLFGFESYRDFRQIFRVEVLERARRQSRHIR